jgi:hypothetical protein
LLFFASREAAMPTRTVGKTEAKQQGTYLAWCVCCVEKGKLRAVFSVLLRHSGRFRRSLWKVFLGAFVLGFD